MDKQSNDKSQNRMDIQPLQNVMKQIDSFFHESRNRFKSIVNDREFPVTTRERTNGYEITAQLAGISREQIRLEAIGNQLHINVRKNDSSVKEQSDAKRIINLPFLIAEGDVRATHKNGLLKIFIPKKQISRDQIDID